MQAFSKLLPGILGCAVAGALAMFGPHLIPTVGPLLWAILLGAILTNIVTLPDVMQPGIGFVGKKVLRAGIVLLGLQLSLGDILGLGWVMLLAVVAIVGIGMATGILAGRALGLSTKQSLLIASGFSICGAAAVAGADGVLNAKEEETATAIGLVVLFGSLMIPIVPLITSAAGLEPHAAALFAGGSIHEVAQVVAAAGIIGGGALGTAVLVKLARVVMLAPVMAGLSLWARRSGVGDGSGKRPPIVPLFVVGFLVMMVVATLKIVPAEWLPTIKWIQTYLLACAMFALGLGVKIKKLIQVGPKPLVLGIINTVVVGLVAWGGMLLAR